MATDRQRAANRANSLKSTGPKSDAGKARSSRNSTVHGLYSTAPLIPGDDPAAFEAFAEPLRRQLNPRNPLEQVIVDRIVMVSWKLHRIPEIEQALVDMEARRFNNSYDPPEKILAEQRSGALRSLEWSFQKMSMMEMRLDRMLHAALRELTKLRKEQREAEEQPAPEAARDETNVRNEAKSEATDETPKTKDPGLRTNDSPPVASSRTIPHHGSPWPPCSSSLNPATPAASSSGPGC